MEQARPKFAVEALLTVKPSVVEINALVIGFVFKALESIKEESKIIDSDIISEKMMIQYIKKII